MRRNKIGAMFLVSVLALAGVGISYAGFTDEIHIYGTVDTATVEIDWIGWYSGTWVYKIYDLVDPTDPPGDPFKYDLDAEILIYTGFVTEQQPVLDQVLTWASDNGGKAELEAYSFAQAGTTQLPADIGTGNYDVDMVYSDIFPCIDFQADFIFHYGGSIPAKINVAEIFPLDDGDSETNDDYPGEGNFLAWLWNYNANNPGYGAWVEACRVEPIPADATGADITGWTMGEPVDIGTQLHYCDYVLVRLVIHLPQDNNLQGLSGVFGGEIGVIQWNDACGPDVTPIIAE